jgi:hypothetical protein
MEADASRNESRLETDRADTTERQTRGLLGRQKLTHVMGAVIVGLALYTIVIPLATLGASTKTIEDVEERSRLLLTMASKRIGNDAANVTHGYYINRSRHDDRLTRTARTEMEDWLGVNVSIKSPAPTVIAGPTGSGKTVLMRRLIDRRREVCDVPPEEVIYCYGAWQPAFENMENVTFHEGLIDFKTQLPSDGKHRWLIIDDLMSESSGNEEVEELFTKHSHHKNVSVFLMVQNFFHKGFRTVTLNAHYLFLFKNPRDASQIGFLARQLFPNNPKFLIESYKDATSEPHSYLTLDLKQSTADEFRVLGNFLAADPALPIVVYTPK